MNPITRTFRKARRRFTGWQHARTAYAAIPPAEARVRAALDADGRDAALAVLIARYNDAATGVYRASGRRTGRYDTLVATADALRLIRYALRAAASRAARPVLPEAAELEMWIGHHLNTLAGDGPETRGTWSPLHDIADALEEYDPQVASNIGAICPDPPEGR